MSGFFHQGRIVAMTTKFPAFPTPERQMTSMVLHIQLSFVQTRVCHTQLSCIPVLDKDVNSCLSWRLWGVYASFFLAPPLSCSLSLSLSVLHGKIISISSVFSLSIYIHTFPQTIAWRAFFFIQCSNACGGNSVLYGQESPLVLIYHPKGRTNTQRIWTNHYRVIMLMLRWCFNLAFHV